MRAEEVQRGYLACNDQLLGFCHWIRYACNQLQRVLHSNEKGSIKAAFGQFLKPDDIV